MGSQKVQASDGMGDGPALTGPRSAGYPRQCGPYECNCCLET